VKIRFMILAIAAIGALGAGLSHLALHSDESLTTAHAEPANNFENYFQYKALTLDNGLRVIMHKDTSSPFVATAVHLHVGSKDEPEGKSGFAHLFEHLHFSGTPQNPGEYFNYLNEIGGANANGMTELDQTYYYQTVPKNSLERILWLEADRLENILAGITPEKLQTQIAVVKNEKSQGDNFPFAASMPHAVSALFPKGHPYHNPVIGSVEDLESASIADLETWHAQSYGARNIVLSLAGDIDYDETEALIRAHFSHLKPGPSVIQDKRRHVLRFENTHHEMTDVSPASQLVRNYALPPINNEDDFAAAIAAEILAGGENAPLYTSLVKEQKLATSVSVLVQYKQLATIVHIYATAEDGVALSDLAAATDEATRQYLIDGPEQEDIDRLYGSEESFILDSATSIGTKASMLAQGLMFNSNPHQALRRLAWYKTLTPAQIQSAAAEWLSGGYHDEYLIGAPAYTAAPASMAARTKPDIGPVPPLIIPEPETFTLSNGLKVALVRRENSPTVLMTLNAAGGWQTYTGEQQVVARLAHDMLLSSGHSDMTRAEIADLRTKLGVYIEGRIGRLNTTYSMSATLPAFESSLDMWSAALTQPEFSAPDFETTLRQRQRALTQAIQDPKTIGQDITEGILLGSVDRLNLTERLDVLEGLKRGQILKHHVNAYQPGDSTLYVAGDFTVDELTPLLEKNLQKWTQTAPPAPTAFIAPSNQITRPRFVLVNEENAAQTQITARRLTSIPYNDRDESHAIANLIFGGGFTSRLNMNLREDKGWTYGISSSIGNIGDMLSTSISASVTATETLNAIGEINAEITQLKSNRPISSTEIDEVVTSLEKSLALLVSDNLNLVSTLLENEVRQRPYNYQETSTDRFKALSEADIQAASQALFQTDNILWTLVGDTSVFEDALREMGIGDVEVYDISGKRLR